MKKNIPVFVRPFRVSWTLIICVLLGACGTLDEVVPPSNELTWVITRDEQEPGQRMHKRSVTIAKGDSRKDLFEKLGPSKEIHYFKKDPSIEVIRYTHTKLGLTTQQTQSTKQGMMQMRAPIRYTETVDVYLNQGIVTVVEISKVEEWLLPLER